MHSLLRSRSRSSSGVVSAFNSTAPSRMHSLVPMLHVLILVLVLIVVLLPAALHPVAAATSVRNASPVRSYSTINAPFLFFDVLSPPALIAARTEGPTVGYATVNAGTALPLSVRADFTIDVNVRLPHPADNPCTGPLNTTDEFGRSFSDAFLLIMQSSCSNDMWKNVEASGAMGILAYSCPASTLR